MKKLSAGPPYIKFIAAASAFTWTIAMANSAGAAQLQEARVTQVVNDVKLLLEQGAPRPAAVSDLIRRGNAVRTGTQSRSELTFADLTITRLGANTIFSFKEGTREMNLIDGAILFQVPKGSGGATIRTVGVTAAITGTTGIGEFHPATSSHPQPFSKWLCLEGTFHLYLANGQSVELGPGKMVTTDGKSFSKVLTFDIAKLTSTSLFFTGFDQPLASMNLITLESENQLATSLLVTTTTNPLDPARIVNVTSQAIVAEETPTSPAASPTPPITPTPPVSPTPPPPTPSKFGTPSVISSPLPYLITNGTTITTDPSITTNGVTNYGTIYRGPVADGAFSLWAFGSTSPVDTALGIDNFFADASRFPIAAFKFQSLSLNGNPIIDTSNSGVTKLALIGVDGITSGPPGGTLTFTGLDLLVLATVNGSINLTSDVSFQDLNELAMYARGAGSDLTINSPISNIGILELAAEDSIQLTNPGTMSVGEFDAITGGGDLTLQIGGSLLLNGKVRLDAIVLPGATVTRGADLALNLTGDYTNSSATEFSRFAVTNQGHIGTGGNISVNIGGNLTATGLGSATAFPEPGDIELLVQNTNAQIDNGGDLNLTVNGNVNVNGLAAYVQNYDGTANPAGHIGTGGNIDIEIGGNLTANSYVDVFLNNRGGGMIDSGGNLTFNVGGALTISADAGGTGLPGFSAEFIISNRYDDSAGNTTPSFIGSDVSLFLHAASVDMAGILYGSGISNRDGSVIDGNATVTWDVPGNVMIQGTTPIPNSLSGASWFIGNNVTTLDQFTPPSGGMIHGNATLMLDIGGDLSIAGDASIEILNQRSFQSTAPRGGTIDSDATLNISAANFSVGGELDIDINNRNNGTGAGAGGSIGGNAAINLNVSGDLAVTGSDPNSGGTPGLANIGIFNEGFVAGSPGGFIGGNASIAVSATNVSTANNLDVEIDNEGGGQIGGDAAINVSAGSITTSSLLAQINNSNGGMIGGAANVAVNVSNDLTALNGIDLHISNSNSGHIVTGADVLYSVGGTTSTTGLSEYIDNTNGGAIDNGGNITLHTVGPVMLDGGLVLEMDNFNGGTINNGANITAHFVGDVTATAGQFHSLNWNLLNGSGFFNPTATGGTIGTGGNINVTFDGNASTTGTLDSGSFSAQIQNGSGGSIGTGGNISVTVGGNVTAGPLFFTTENQGGHLGTGGNMTLQVAGDITTQGDANFQIFNNDNGNGSGPGAIDLDATINVTAANISSGGSLFDEISNFSGGNIGGNANLNFSLTGDLTTQGDGAFTIDNSNGGTIGGNATITVNADNISAGGSFVADIESDAVTGGHITTGASVNLTVGGNLTTASGGNLELFIDNQPGTIGTDANILASIGGNVAAGQFCDAIIFNTGGSIGSNADITTNIMGDLTAGNAAFGIYNFGGGTIGSNAGVTVSIGGDLVSAGDAEFFIWNYGLAQGSGSIGQNAFIDVNLTGDLNVQATADFEIINSNDGGNATIGGDATINVGAASITANSLVAQIDNTGGSIGASTEGGATINMNVSGTATVTNDATVAIYGSDGAVGGAAININGGNYNVGGTFLSYIDGNGTITFNNASAHADVLKAGVFGANGALNIGGGMLSADSTLKLYAPGSNGALNFVSNVTLGGNGLKILAANSITISNSVVVTISIGGPMADVYTNNANYTGFGGNGTTTGTFAGAGANNPQPLSSAPPFGPSSPHTVATGGHIPIRTGVPPESAPVRTPAPSGKIADVRRASNVINVRSSDELLSLLDGADRGPGGKITVPAPKSASNSRNSNRTGPAARLNAGSRLNVDRRAVDMRTASSSVMRRSPQ